jgi:alpha-ketoglutarate-dependent taurine dioxygenase
MLEIEPLAKHLGAEVKGVDLGRELDAGVFHRIEQAYNRYAVLVFRDQRITPAQHIAFARRFGELEISPRTRFALSGHPEILVLSNIVENGEPIGNADAGRTWHTDLSYTRTPPRGSLLYALEVPARDGKALGDTIFASTAAAYDALPPARQQALAGLKAVHRGSAKRYAAGSKLAESVRDFPDVTHPVIRTHPITGRKSIYVRAGECVGIVGMPDEEALPLLDELSEFVTRPAFLYRHRWRVGDLLMWDNSTTQHLAVDDYALPLRRLMHRVTVNGSAPF